MIIATDNDLREYLIKCLQLDLEKGPYELTGGKYKPNTSRRQQKTFRMWIGEIAIQSHQKIDEVYNYLTWTYALPILMGGGDNNAELYNVIHTHLIENFTYEICLKNMQIIAITSKMKVSQMWHFMSHVQLYAGENGYKLTDPDERDQEFINGAQK